MTRSLSSDSRTMRALAHLRQLLLEGAFAPGQRLLEQKLVDRLGVSRSPLRLVLNMLQHEGLVEPLPGGGYVVRAFSAADLEDIMELRGVIEATAARRAAERRERAADTLERMRQACGAMDTVLATYHGSEALARYFKHDQLFHSLLLQLAGSSTLTRSLKMLRLPLSPDAVAAGKMQPPTIQGLLVMQSHHQALFDAIDRGEGTRAESIAHEHWRRVCSAVQFKAH